MAADASMTSSWVITTRTVVQNGVDVLVWHTKVCIVQAGTKQHSNRAMLVSYPYFVDAQKRG